MSDAPPDPKPPSRFDWTWAGYWTLVFLANLPVPAFLAIGILPSIGLLGLAAGLVVLYWVGLMVCGCRFRVGRSLVWGGIATAVSQFLPILQFACGMLGLLVWRWTSGCELGSFDNVGEDDGRDLGSPIDGVGAFVVVLLTAQPMWVVAILTGALFRSWAGDTPIWSHPPADPDADPDLSENPAS